MSEGADKPHDPTPERLRKAREEGDIPKSPDLTWAAACGGFVLAALVAGPGAMRGAGDAAMVLIDQAPALSRLMMDSASAPLAGILRQMLVALWPFFALPLLGALAALALQRGLRPVPSKLKLKSSRISPLSNAKQKFGPDGMFEFGKSFIKMMLIGTILVWFLMGRATELLATLYLDPGVGIAVILRLVVVFLAIVLGLSLMIGGADYGWQRLSHTRRNRMSRQDVLDEHKASEGDPHMKHQRRQRGMAIAMNRMLADVPKADVVIVNPTHYAVALAWDRAAGGAPVCVAKGVDEIAARIRKAAAEAGVPIHSDPPTARTLHASVEIGAQIHPDHYRAVAAAIRFADTLRKKAKR
ncbi:EscU/YscU/HrcU family type III secretion system export apparatus switch protein [Falsirhodobacter halotolerans]|uniref:EscU/YscU/HrcU family type III secretion system export apparatus switch protein n=1 Tax=Falsirhodobacter halotolerans TaxID=1146892 RepID=UPI001FD30397|nr:flagellar type III secretion system protein FlhB [Falsirhodobacter halotolerans]MCJ8140555.1 flagellar type III secretion system protein FlhB [Falsirhodobacter halotolerans]